jgi:Family of unknown function (DUF6252)
MRLHSAMTIFADRFRNVERDALTAFEECLMRSMRRSVLVAGWILAAGCGSATDAGDQPEDLAVGTIVGTIDGTNWTTTAAIAINAGGRVTVAGTGTQNLTFGFGVTATTPGTYGVGSTGNASGSLTDGSGTVWEAAVAGGSGTLTITNSVANQIEGTFSFTMVRTIGSGSPTTRTITNGRFNLKY